MAEGRDEAACAPVLAPSRAGAAMLIIGMAHNAGSASTKREAGRVARTIATLRAAADAAGVPVIRVDDAAASPPASGTGPAARLPAAVGRVDHLVVKTQFSSFHATTLKALLDRLGVDRLILSGTATDIAVMFTAADAHVRDYGLWVPADAVAGTSIGRHRWALELMHRSLAAEIRPTSLLPLDRWLSAPPNRGGVALPPPRN